MTFPNRNILGNRTPAPSKCTTTLPLSLLATAFRKSHRRPFRGQVVSEKTPFMHEPGDLGVIRSCSRQKKSIWDRNSICHLLRRFRRSKCRRHGRLSGADAFSAPRPSLKNTPRWFFHVGTAKVSFAGCFQKAGIKLVDTRVTAAVM